MTLSRIALLHAGDDFSRCINLYGFRLFIVLYDFIHQMAPMSVVVQEVGV